jgi:hypothetical protein
VAQYLTATLAKDHSPTLRRLATNLSTHIAYHNYASH